MSLNIILWWSNYANLFLITENLLVCGPQDLLGFKWNLLFYTLFYHRLFIYARWSHNFHLLLPLESNLSFLTFFLFSEFICGVCSYFCNFLSLVHIFFSPLKEWFICELQCEINQVFDQMVYQPHNQFHKCCMWLQTFGVVMGWQTGF